MYMASETEHLLWARKVPQAYDKVAEAWHKERATAAKNSFRERRFLDQLVAPLSPGASIFDVGCGTGTPIMQYLVGRGLRVTGLDVSARMLALAREAFSNAILIQADVRTADVPGPFDAIIAWDSI